MRIKVRKEYFCIPAAIAYTLFLFQDPVSLIYAKASYLDEAESISALILILICCRNRLKMDADFKRIGSLFLFFLFCGAVGSFLFCYQKAHLVLLDMLEYSKFFLNLFACAVFISKDRVEKYENTIRKVSLAASAVLFILALHDQFFPPFFPYLEDRYGLKSLRLFFSNQTYLGVTGVILFLVHYITGEGRRYNIIFLLMDVFISVVTFRTKILGFWALTLVLMVCVYVIKARRYFSILLVGGLAGFLAGRRYIWFYFFSDQSNMFSPRKRLMADGLRLALLHFPFGAGFGTFCSAAARINYSPVYVMLGYDSSLLMRNGTSLNDMFWAGVAGQFGLIGGLTYALIFLYMIVCLYKYRKTCKRYFYSIILGIGYLLIASFGENSLIANYAALFGIMIGCCWSKIKYEYNR